MSAINHLVKTIDRATRAVNAISMGVLFVIMALSVIGVITRILGMPFSGITNLSESLLVVTIYLGIAYTQQKKQHVQVEFLLINLGPGKRRVLKIFDLIVPLVVCIIFITTSWEYAISSWEIREKMDGAPFYPIYPPKIAIAVGMTLLGLQLLSDLLRVVFSKCLSHPTDP